ncbi:MAG: hypothetical protein JNL10_00080, partial [Verrucomicrobiales bacterium]|nr:hypothetical protein [Verrucomicrobiales bacterium]
MSSGQRRTALMYLSLAAASLTYGIGIDPYDPLVLSDTVKQSIVRIQGSHVDAFNSPDPDSILGTGTIIDVHRDATGTGGWLCILTADHVAGHHLGAGLTSPEWKVGFGGGTASGTWDIVANSATAKVVRGPVDKDDNRVDLAVLAVRYADVTRFQPVLLAQATVGESVILAGYGGQATLNPLD